LRLDSLRIRMHAALDNLPRREIVTMHEAFAYFAAEFNLRVAATIEREPGSGPSAADLASIIRLVNARGITAVFSEPQYPAESAGAIAHETGARVYTLDPAVTGPLDKDAYIRIMDANRVVLAGALR
jgi:zinc transport system substrate-binding protein